VCAIERRKKVLSVNNQEKGKKGKNHLDYLARQKEPEKEKVATILFGGGFHTAIKKGGEGGKGKVYHE